MYSDRAGTLITEAFLIFIFEYHLINRQTHKIIL